jgi:hypothetical protein
MRTNSFKKLAVLCSLVAFGTYGILFACADYFWGYDYDSNFTPEAYVDESYSPLFFAPQDVFYSIGFEVDYTSRFNRDIVAEWSGYLKGKFTDKELSFLLLNDSADARVKELYIAAQKKQKLPVPYARLSATDPQVKEFVEFLYYAKEIESSSTTPLNSWSYDEVQPAAPVNPKTLAQVEKLYNETSDPFLKNRYWFQTMKAYFYSSNKQGTVTFFEKTKAGVPQNILYYRGLSYIAGVYYKKKDYTTSNYLYSVVFDKCPALRTVTAYNFHPQEQKDFQASLALAKTPEEKAGLWALFGYYADEKTAIREIYKLNPASEHLDYLLTRLVNKEEVRLNDMEFKSATAYKQTMKEQINKDALQLVITIAKEEKTGKPHLWNLAAGYLNILAGNNSQALQLIEKADKKGPKSELASNQIRLLKLINTLSSTTKMDEKSEGKLLAELDWLYHIKDSEDEVFRYRNALGWSKQYIASLYAIQQNVVMAELFNGNTAFYQTSSNAEAMKAFLHKTDKSPWEKLAAGIYGITLSDIYEYQAVMNAYAGKLDEAIALMEQSAEGKDVELYGNPFNGKIKDCHDCDHAASQKVKYTKLSFLKKMKEMQSLVDKGQDVYNNSLLLGNAYYNMTYFGNARVIYYNDIINQYGNYIDEYYQPVLLNCTTANQYYEKAFNAAANAEQKAKCVYMMAKCERNAFYTKEYHTKNDFWGEPEVAFQAWNGFKKLKTEYSNTRYYKEVINECGYFRKYVGK